MGYSIKYSPEKDDKFPAVKEHSGLMMKIGLAIIAALLTAVLMKQGGVDFVRELLLPGDPECTERAAEMFVENVRAGESVGDAAAAFCREIINNAQ